MTAGQVATVPPAVFLKTVSKQTNNKRPISYRNGPFVIDLQKPTPTYQA